MNRADAVRSGWRRTGLLACTMMCLLLTDSTAQNRKGDDRHRALEEAFRPVTVADAIQMTQFGDLSYVRGVSARDNPACFSPDGTHFVIITTNGSIERNTNDYALLLFQTSNALASPTPEVLVALSSSSDRPAIQDIIWVDNHTVAFLGEKPGERQQVYEVDCRSKRLTSLTNHSTNVISYAITQNQEDLFFLAERPEELLYDKQALRDGLVVTNQFLADLLPGTHRITGVSPADLFETKVVAHKDAVRIVGDYCPWSHPWVSPNGQYLIVETFVNEVPEAWRNYQDRSLQLLLQSDPANRAKALSRYELMDVVSHKTEALLDAPAGGGGPCTATAVIWSPDSHSVIVSATYLPLSVDSSAERELRRSKKLTVEIKVPSLDVVRITSREICARGWAFQSGKLLAGVPRAASASTVSYEDFLAFQKSAGGWHEVQAPPAGLDRNDRIAITLEEDMNTRPRLFAEELQSGRKSMLLDFNPEFEKLRFGRVQDISFQASDGHKVRAGLYLPPGYVAGRKYPLVIQTHGWDPHRFWIDGPFATAFAAQPMAGRGIAVLQVDEDLSKLSTSQEAAYEAAAYEGGIDYLDSLGIIDRKRVGIVAFSRTGIGVTYALTHSRYRFAAANIAGSGDQGYFSYLSSLGSFPGVADDYEAVNGGSPFGAGLAFWLKNCSAFNLTRVTTPTRLEAHGASILLEWEWFAGLSRLHKPVELIEIPYGEHVLVKPWERLVSQQATVDWFSFWLQGYEDPDPAKAAQYVRWRKLRTLQQENDTAK
jgi:dipeptidyl aminopeptidase/acylaminoacyl peptidase